MEVLKLDCYKQAEEAVICYSFLFLLHFFPFLCSVSDYIYSSSEKGPCDFIMKSLRRNP